MSKQITLVISAEAFEALLDHARIERRAPREHAGYLLEVILGARLAEWRKRPPPGFDEVAPERPV